MRKIIQISSIFLPEGGGYNPSVHIYALCDDGEVWEHVTATDKWMPLPAVPQDEPEAPLSSPPQSPDTAADDLPSHLAGKLWLVTSKGAAFVTISWKFVSETYAAIANTEPHGIVLVYHALRDEALRVGSAWLDGHQDHLEEEIYEFRGQAVKYVVDNLPF